ncbi:Gfo/Idh/MocA family oxidoreductase [Chryseosolibacter indicus]|uniref:Gfo/Idh/MocA family oxidoreductase n=1 Tax=Chryseosolibacter indicus TaxID=2782351 RepID=A0ABS5VTX5_9BACT|nr:Gfo/Idh/MocA family oxidoreductase [Chryseosolibacter indicus]MBT1704875.1 Gfo/Idh/MocA family oxidoreductase [Chryseosolibacter indicus]
MKNFALIGAAGFIAPRHLKAIKETGNNLVAAIDKHDNVGILDSYFPNADFFIEFERFDRHLDKIKRKGANVDYISICSPNYLHDSHIRYALRYGADAICEKPLVLNPWNIDALQELESETGKKINTILQLRLHPSIIALREKIKNGPKDKIYDVDLQYMTSRGNWYHISWKGDLSKSGGIATNIGIHFFDMLMWIFGKVQDVTLSSISSEHASGILHLEHAKVTWFLSINYDHIPQEVRDKGKRTYRTLKLEGEEIEFSEGFTDLHTKSYEEILKGNGFGLVDAKPSIDIVYKIRKLAKGNV